MTKSRENYQERNIIVPKAVQGYLTASECHRISSMRGKLPRMEGKVGPQTKYESDYRRSEIYWIPACGETEWIFNKIHLLVMQANKHYQFHLTGFREDFQLATYASEGYFEWHMDLGVNKRKSTRKLSVTVQLSEQSEYDGGDLEFFGFKDAPMPRQIGSAIVFPSFLLHRVTPVISGTRQSLVAWAHGPTLR